LRGSRGKTFADQTLDEYWGKYMAESATLRYVIVSVFWLADPNIVEDPYYISGP
jgi:hypothetical protein